MTLLFAAYLLTDGAFVVIAAILACGGLQQTAGRLGCTGGLSSPSWPGLSGPPVAA
jgi:hypothetical protein